MVLAGLVHWVLLCRHENAGTRDFCSALAALVGPVQYIFSSPYTIYCIYFNYFVPIAQQAGRAAVLGRLSHSVHVSGTGLMDKFLSSIKCGLFIPL